MVDILIAISTTCFLLGMAFPLLWFHRENQRLEYQVLVLQSDLRMTRKALELLLSDVESTSVDRAAYGMPVENEEHPFHESVTKARLVLT